MEKIINRYNELVNISSDINEHLPTLKRYTEECDSVIEMGVRTVVSTWAFLAGSPKKMISYDILRNSNVAYVEYITKQYGLDYKFIESDVLKIDIDNIDLLFIDTYHTYNQLTAELIKHSNKVNKYIILHDTTTFAFNDEGMYNHVSDLVKNTPKEKMGLKNALNEFLNTELGSIWEIKEEFTNNNGLTILKRK